MYKNFSKLILVIFISLFQIFYLNTSIKAQGQQNAFSGNDTSSYQCIDSNGTVNNNPVTFSNGVATCNGTAVLIPPKLQQLELWFVRGVYIIWAVVASLSFLMLTYLGFQYMITRGDVTKITEIRMKIIYYIIGFVLVFLAVPIISTTFRLMGINNEEPCYSENFSGDDFLPGFRFFYPTTCYDGSPTGV